MKLKLKHRERPLGVAFTSPWLVGMAVFQINPLAVYLYYSFTHYNLLS